VLGILKKAHSNDEESILVKIVNAASMYKMDKVAFRNILENYCHSKRSKLDHGLQAYELGWMVEAQYSTLIFMHNLGSVVDVTKPMHRGNFCAEYMKVITKTEKLCEASYIHGDIHHGNLLYKEDADNQLCLIDWDECTWRFKAMIRITITKDQKERYPEAYTMNGVLYTKIQLYVLFRDLVKHQTWKDGMALISDVSKLNEKDFEDHYEALKEKLSMASQTEYGNIFKSIYL
jgi:hypothetical protein